MMAEFQAAEGGGWGVPHVLPPMKKAGCGNPRREVGASPSAPLEMGRLSGAVGWEDPHTRSLPPAPPPGLEGSRRPETNPELPLTSLCFP